MTFMPLEWECLPSDESKRFVLLLSPLPLCLRFGSLQQFPSTLDFIRLAGAYRGGIAALAALFVLSVEGGRTALAAVRTTGNVRILVEAN